MKIVLVILAIGGLVVLVGNFSIPLGIIAMVVLYPVAQALITG